MKRFSLVLGKIVTDVSDVSILLLLNSSAAFSIADHNVHLKSFFLYLTCFKPVYNLFNCEALLC